MTGKKEKLFLIDAQRVAFDYKHRATIRYNISRYDDAVAKGRLRYTNIELAREQAAFIKRKVLSRLPDYLELFEKNAIANGCEVFWARNSEEAGDLILNILNESEARSVVKSKSMTTEEVEVNQKLEGKGIESIETDLGEFIVQTAGEKPYHIVTPAMHKSKRDIAALFNKNFSISKDASPEEMTSFVRGRLRKKFRNADVGITGANFLLAREGGIALTENEGNAFMSYSFPRIQIVIAGIEKVLPSMHDLNLMWPLLAAHGTGQKVTVYNSVVFGPAKRDEKDGPKKMIVILLDNGRSHLYELEQQSKALSCIRCGACLNVCPIYKNIGGYTYNSVYTGPIGAVITPVMRRFKAYQHLSFASSLCGKCEEVCPVKIPLPALLLENRRESLNQKLRPVSERLLMKGMQVALTSRKMMNRGGGDFKNFTVRMSGVDSRVGRNREFPKFASRSFSQQWIKKRK